MSDFTNAVAAARERADRERRERDGEESPIRRSLQRELRKVANHVFLRPRVGRP